MTYDVVVRKVEAQLIAAVPRIATRQTLGATIQEALGEVWEYLRRSPQGAPGRNVVVYHDDKFTLDIGVEIQPPFTESDSVRLTATPSGRVAMTVVHGSHTKIPEANRAIREACAREHQHFAGPSWEVYGHWTGDESEFTIEVYYLLSDSNPVDR